MEERSYSYVNIIWIYLKRTGPNRWRDSRKPSQILADICKLRNLSLTLPNYGESTLVADKTIFTLDKYGNLVA